MSERRTSPVPLRSALATGFVVAIIPSVGAQQTTTPRLEPAECVTEALTAAAADWGRPTAAMELEGTAATQPTCDEAATAVELALWRAMAALPRDSFTTACKGHSCKVETRRDGRHRATILLPTSCPVR